MNMDVDIRHTLPAIRVPTLVLHRTGDLTVPVEMGRYMAERIPGARYVELPGVDHLPFVGDQESVLGEIQQFLVAAAGARAAAAPNRVLATVLVAEIVGATEAAARLAGQRQRRLLESIDPLVSRELAEFQGRQARSTDTGFLATFVGPTRAIRCACAVIEAARRVGVDIRAGLHVGECDLEGDETGGLAFQVGARVMAQAGPGQLLVSSTVKELVVGSGIEFEDLGSRDLRGLPGEWRLFRVRPETRAGFRLEAPAGERAREAGPGPNPLSQREQEVAALIALGLSNRQIAEKLVLAVGTVERHVANIFNKLGCHSRAQVATWAAERGLAKSPATQPARGAAPAPRPARSAVSPDRPSRRWR